MTLRADKTNGRTTMMNRQGSIKRGDSVCSPQEMYDKKSIVKWKWIGIRIDEGNEEKEGNEANW